MKKLTPEQQLELNMIQIRVVQKLPEYLDYGSMIPKDRIDLIDSTEKLAKAEFLQKHPELK